MRRTEFTKWKPDYRSWVGQIPLHAWSGGSMFRALTALLLALFFAMQANAQCTIVCNDDAQVSLPGTVSNCEALVTHDMVMKSPLNVCPGWKTVTVFDRLGNPLPAAPYGGGHTGSLVNYLYVGQRLTVRVRDNLTGNYCWGHINIEDKQPPLVFCRDTTVYCLVNPRPIFDGGDLPAAVVTDCSGTPTLVYTDQAVTGTCNDPFSQIITRTWIATDRNGNANSCTQIITLNKVSLSNPLVVPHCPDNVVLECNTLRIPSTHPRHTGYPYIILGGVRHNVVPGGNYVCELASSYSDEVFDLCGGGTKILRTWTIYDWCLPVNPGVNPFACIQVIKIEDRTPPIVHCPAPIVTSTNSWSCSANVTMPPAVVRDSCSNFNVTIITPAGVVSGNGGLLRNVPVGNHIATYIATDECGNTASCTTTLTVRDEVPPVAVCQSFTIVSLTSDGTAVVPAASFNSGSHDNCEIDHFEVRRMPDVCQDTTYFDEYAYFDCCDVGRKVMVIFRAIDKSGNHNDCMVEVEVQDKLPPVVICPPDKTIDCTEHVTDFRKFGMPTITDNCDSVRVEERIDRHVDQCGVGYINRIFIGTDQGGRKDSCTQRITVRNNDPFNEDDIEWPLDWTTHECGVSVDPDDIPCDVYNYCRPKLHKDGCGLLAVTYTDQLLPISYPACYKILRKWIVIDWCQYDPNATVYRGYWTRTQIIKVLDDQPPVLVCPPDTIYADNFNANCAPTRVVIPPVTATDCSTDIDFSVKVDLNNNGVFDTTFVGPDATGRYPNGTHLLHIKAEDNCGNFSLCEVILIVRDLKKPTAVCLNGVSATLMPDGRGNGMVTLTPEMFNNGSFDNCTPQNRLKFKLEPRTFTCAELGINLVRLSVTDADGNTDWCETFVDIQDNMGVCSSTSSTKIAGAIKNQAGAGVQNVKVDLNGGGSVLNSMTTTASGMYEFANLQTGYDYSIAPKLNDDAANGISTFDLVLISKHILNVQYLDNAYKVIAADVNNSKNVSTLDLVALRRVVLRVDNAFAKNTSWRFIDKNYVFTDPMNPWNDVFPEVINFNNLNTNQLLADFVAVKIGDVNGSAKVATIGNGIEERSGRADLVMAADELSFRAGETVSVPVSADDFTGILGFQFTLEFNPKTLELSDIRPGLLDKLSENNFGLTKVNEGIVTASWDNSKATLTGKTGALFTLQFRAKTDGQLSDVLKISSQLTEAEAYAATAEKTDLEIRNVRLQFKGGLDGTAGFELYQNTPNPFSHTTSISFNLPASSFATLTIYDLNGKVLKTQSGIFAKGRNEVTISERELGSNGVLYYTLETPTHTATKKMIIVK